jgi:hypothetical protein
MKRDSTNQFKIVDRLPLQFGGVIILLFFSVFSYSGEPGLVHRADKAEKENGIVELLVSSSDQKLWTNSIRPYLQAPLWRPRDIYDAGHHLMIPLHAAFLWKVPEWKRDFELHFRRFLTAYPEGIESGVKQRLNRLHYFYLISRYLALSVDEDNNDFKIRLYNVVLIEVEKLWNTDPAWQWGRQPFIGGIRERVLWKLDTKDVSVSYHRAIIDEELFLFAIAADLLASSSLIGDVPSKTLLDITSVARRVFETEIVETEHGGWLFQPGVWADGPGHAYAGQMQKSEGMKEMPLVDVAWDSSHSHRFPLWITSLENANALGGEDNIFYQKLKKGLATQLINKVLIHPSEKFPAWRVTNYMDGRNGVYRWREKDGFGYGPYELSGTFLIGWWAFLNNDDISSVYRDLASSFPLQRFVVEQYVGPNTPRERHPLVVLPGKYENGLIELITRLASKLHYKTPL